MQKGVQKNRVSRPRTWSPITGGGNPAPNRGAQIWGGGENVTRLVPPPASAPHACSPCSGPDSASPFPRFHVPCWSSAPRFCIRSFGCASPAGTGPRSDHDSSFTPPPLRAPRPALFAGLAPSSCAHTSLGYAVGAESSL